MKEYEDGYKLLENEYLLKLRKGIYRDADLVTGFLSKYTQKGAIPKAFQDWGKTPPKYENLPIYIFTEIPKSGWKIYSWRFGQSQNWATVIHPDGFTLEIYLDQFLEIVKNNTIIAGEIQGCFYWKDNKLVISKV
jgi:hypothetical protein